MNKIDNRWFLKFVHYCQLDGFHNLIVTTESETSVYHKIFICGGNIMQKLGLKKNKEKWENLEWSA